MARANFGAAARRASDSCLRRGQERPAGVAQLLFDLGERRLAAGQRLVFRRQPIAMRNRLLERPAVLALEPLDQRQAILDLLQSSGRRVDAVREIAQREGEVLELRLDAVAGVEVRREARIDGRQLADALPHVAERGERRAFVVVQLGVAFAAQPLNGVGAAQQLPIGGERFVFARLQVGLLQFVQLELDEVEARGPLPIVHAQPIELFAPSANGGERVRHRARVIASRPAHESSNARCCVGSSSC